MFITPHAVWELWCENLEIRLLTNYILVANVDQNNRDINNTCVCRCWDTLQVTTVDICHGWRQHLTVSGLSSPLTVRWWRHRDVSGVVTDDVITGGVQVWRRMSGRVNKRRRRHRVAISNNSWTTDMSGAVWWMRLNQNEVAAAVVTVPWLEITAHNMATDRNFLVTSFPVWLKRGITSKPNVMFYDYLFIIKKFKKIK